ncbi:hypothetical protein BJY00DRAFT_327355 [Aspergillus carlsbadensis]|nr:hypothetical protein BJY00DRAFT_327355 [Aspergillus carlsbadensis]
MKFHSSFYILLFSAVQALPCNEADAPKFTVPSSMTVQQGSSKCGTQAQLSCCNKVKYGGDTTAIGGALTNLLGAGSAAEGLGIFTECSKLDIPVIGVEDILNQQCKQNIACCDKSGGGSLPCIALGSIL